MIQRSTQTRHRSQHHPASDQRIFFLILGIFLILRLIGLDSDYLWIDNLAQLSGGLEKIPWNAVLDTTIKETLTSTNPFFPMLMFRVLMNLFGPHTLILRIPAVVFACLALYLLHRSLAKLFAHKAAVYLPQWLFAFSIPSILYSRQITQIVFYFLTTVIQLYLFITMVQTLSPDTSNHAIRRSIRIFAAISLLMLLCNWMSGLVYGLLLGSYTLLGLFRRPPQQSQISRFALFCQEIIVVSIPIAILVYFRSRGGESVRSYLEAYYVEPETLWRLPLLAYDFLTYHCNFAYTPNLYFPLKANIVTLPFTLLCVTGIVAFVRARREHLALAGFAVILIGLAIALKAMPFGGVRHSLTLARLSGFLADTEFRRWMG